MNIFERALEEKVYSLSRQLGSAMGHLELLLADLENLDGGYLARKDMERARTFLAEIRGGYSK